MLSNHSSERERDHHGNKSASYTLLQICSSTAGGEDYARSKAQALENVPKTQCCISHQVQMQNTGGCAIPKAHNQVRVVVCKIVAEHCTKRRRRISGALKSFLIIAEHCN